MPFIYILIAKLVSKTQIQIPFTIEGSSIWKIKLSSNFVAPELALSEWEAKPEIVDGGDDYILVTLVDPFSQRNGRIDAYSIVVTTEPTNPEIKGGSEAVHGERGKGRKKEILDGRIFSKCQF